jgi:hypothetical protein
LGGSTNMSSRSSLSRSVSGPLRSLAVVLGASMVVATAVQPVVANDGMVAYRPAPPKPSFQETARFRETMDFFEIADRGTSDAYSSAATHTALVTLTCLAGCATQLSSAPFVVTTQSYATATSASLAPVDVASARPMSVNPTAFDVATIESVQCLAGCASTSNVPARSLASLRTEIARNAATPTRVASSKIDNKQAGLKQTGLKQTGLKQTGLKQTGPKYTGPRYTGLKNTGRSNQNRFASSAASRQF